MAREAFDLDEVSLLGVVVESAKPPPARSPSRKAAPQAPAAGLRAYGSWGPSSTTRYPLGERRIEEILDQFLLHGQTVTSIAVTTPVAPAICRCPAAEHQRLRLALANGFSSGKGTHGS